jgi:hypothetical protein
MSGMKQKALSNPPSQPPVEGGLDSAQALTTNTVAVNASMAALRLATHDSGPGWFATPFLYDSFIHYSRRFIPAHSTTC